MKKLFIHISIAVLLISVSCINRNTEQPKNDNLKKEIPKYLYYDKKDESILKIKATDTIKKVVESTSSNILGFIGPIFVDFNTEESHVARQFLNAFNKALKWGKLNKTIKINFKKELMNFTQIDYESIGGVGATPQQVSINFNFTFVGSDDGTWTIKILPDKAKLNGYYVASTFKDAAFLKEKEVNEVIFELKEIILRREKQDKKEKLFN